MYMHMHKTIKQQTSKSRTIATITTFFSLSLTLPLFQPHLWLAPLLHLPLPHAANLASASASITHFSNRYLYDYEGVGGWVGIGDDADMHAHLESKSLMWLNCFNKYFCKTTDLHKKSGN